MTRQSDKFKSIFHSIPLKQYETIHIDLIESNSTSGVDIEIEWRGFAARGGATSGAATRGDAAATTSSAAQSKGKRIVTIVEKEIKIMEVKRRMKLDLKH